MSIDSPLRVPAGRIAALLPICLIFLSILSNPSSAQDFRLEEIVTPVFEAIELRIDPEQMSYTGTVWIELRCSEQASSFRLHAEEIELLDVELQGPGGAVPVSYEVIDNHQIRVDASAPLQPEKIYTLRIDFSQEYDTTARGLYRLVTEGDAYLFTQFEAVDARQAFPCFDEPRFKIPWQMTLSVPEGQQVFSNTPVEQESIVEGWRRVEFARTQPMPSYLLALAAGPLETVEVPGMDIPTRIITVKGKSGLTGEAMRVTPPLTKALEEYFGRPYPYQKLDLVAVPEYWAGAMENVGFITYRETILLVDPEAGTIGQKRGLASTTAHEIAHMWFGNLVTMEWWDDLWLNEAFATWIGNKITDQVFPEYSIAIENVRPVQGAMGTDAMMSARAIRQPVTDDATIMQSADGLTYQKGMAVLGMFESWMGEDLFRQAVLNYIEEKQWGNARADDLWAALSETSGVDVGAAMSTFLDQPGVPLLTATDLGDGKVELRQERFLNYGAEMETETTWELPVVFRYYDGKEVRTHRVLLTESVETIEIPSSGELDWIHPNNDEKGYYHWSLSPDRLRRLSENSVEIMDTRERVGFVGHVSALLSAGQIDGATYLEVIAPLARDPQPEVVSAMLSSLGLVRMAFVTPELEDAFAAYVLTMLAPARERFGLRPVEGEAESAAILRPQLVAWLGKYGHDPEVIAYAKEVTEGYLEDRSAADPQVVGACLQIAAMDGGWKLYNAYKTGFEEAAVPTERQRFLGALGWFRDDTMMKSALSYTLKGDLRPQELFSIPMGIGQSGDHGAEILWTWMTGNYDALMERIPPVFAVYMPYFAMGCTDDRLEAARVFFAEDGPHYMDGQEKELAKVAENVGNCISLRAREGEAVASYLRSVAGM